MPSRRPARAALEIVALIFVCPGELRAAEWPAFDLDVAVWEISLGRMKMRKPHRVPLAARVLAILKEPRKLTGQGTLLFPSVRSVARCTAENTLNAALRRMGFKNEDMTSHGYGARRLGRACAFQALRRRLAVRPTPPPSMTALVETSANF
jgi:integrase